MELKKEEYDKLKDKLFCLNNITKKKGISKQCLEYSALLDYIYNNQKYYRKYCQCVFTVISNKCLKCSVDKIKKFIEREYE